MTQNKQTRTRTLNPERKANLLHSVIGYLQKNGFSKTLKRFLSETQIKNEEWKTSSLDLEVLYCKYLDTCNNAETNVKTYKKEEGTTKEEGKSNCAASEELIKKKKKKSRKSSDSPDQREQIQFVTMKNQVENTVNEEMGELTTKNKDRKKKKSTPTSESSLNNVDQEKIDSLQLVVEEQSKGSASAVCDIKKEKKSSKKRKRPGSDESEYQASVNEVNEESRQKKTELLEESKKQDKHTTNYGGKESKQENGELDKNLGEKTSNFQLEQANGTLEKSGDKSASQKSKRKQHSASTEPKTVNVFQRVKIDEVEFADEKLQDNSYWAKDGSEVGYGAKAQEVLGQVRGRDFRHEKTKKKRGSYRGGQIEQGSHSIKFNYSDED